MTLKPRRQIGHQADVLEEAGNRVERSIGRLEDFDQPDDLFFEKNRHEHDDIVRRVACRRLAILTRAEVRIRQQMLRLGLKEGALD